MKRFSLTKIVSCRVSRSEVSVQVSSPRLKAGLSGQRVTPYWGNKQLGIQRAVRRSQVYCIRGIGRIKEIYEGELAGLVGLRDFVTVSKKVRKFPSLKQKTELLSFQDKRISSGVSRTQRKEQQR